MPSLREKYTTEARSLETEIQAAMVDGDVPVEQRDAVMQKSERLHVLEGVIGEMKDEELRSLTAQLEAAQAHGGETPQGNAADTAFRDYLRTGNVSDEQRASLIAGTNAEGGYLVPPETSAPLIEALRKNNPILGAVTQLTLTGNSSMKLPAKATHGAVATAGETDARTEQNAPTFSEPELVTNDLYTDQRATQLFLDEVAGAEGMLLGWIYDDIAEQWAADVVNGNGTGKSKGLFAESYASVTTAAAGAIANTDIFGVYFATPTKYRSTGVWVVQSSTLAVLAVMKHPASDSVPLLTQAPDGSWTCLGRKVVEADNAPAIAAGAKPLWFGDLKSAYVAGTHKAVSTLRDPYTATPKIRFYAVGRFGGCAWDTSAGKFLTVKSA